MTSKSMTFRFPALLAQAIEAQARATGRDRTTVVAEALAQAFGLSLPSKAPVTIEMLQQQLEQAENSIVQLSDRVVTLQHSVQTNDALAYRLRMLEQLTAALQLLLRGIPTEETATPLPSTVEMVYPDEQARLAPETATSRLQITARDDQTALHEGILAAIPVPLFVCDRALRLTYINALGARSLGLEPEGLLHQAVQELPLPLELRTQLTLQLEAVFVSGRSITSEVSLSMPPLGTRHYEYTLSPIQSTATQIDAVLYSTQDLTDRKTVEAALRVAEAHYQNLFESTNDSILILDAATQQILNANGNTARWLGYTRQELTRLSLDAIMPKIAAAITAERSQQLRSRGSILFAHFLRHKDGTEIPVEVSSWLVEYGDRLAIQSFVRDMGESRHRDD